jgi:hypothetical protein
MTYFGRVRGGGTFHMEDEEGISIQFAVGYYGEDPSLVIEAFWKEQDGGGDFLVVPLLAHGKAPRGELCTPQSLRMALETAKPNPDSREGQQWAIACQRHGIDWPKRLQEPSSTKAPLKAVASG